MNATATEPDTTLPVGPAKTAAVRSMFDTIAPRYDLVNRVITLGLDHQWRKATVAALGLPPRALVLDLACGTGGLTTIAHRLGYQVLGADLSAGMLAANHSRAPLVESEAAHMALADGSVDGLVCGYALRNFTDLRASLVEMARVLRPGGRVAVLEIATPAGGVWRAGFDLWFRKVVPVLGGLLSDPAAYRYLPRSTAYLPDAPELRRLFLDAGFSGVGIRLLNGGLSQLVTATRTGLPSGSGR